jgi:hypothetical protein
MDRSILIVLGLAAVAVAQDPFVPLDLSAPGPVLDQAGARQGGPGTLNMRSWAGTPGRFGTSS